MPPQRHFLCLQQNVPQSKTHSAEANLSNTTLTWADLSSANLSSANLSGANLRKASLVGAGLTGHTSNQTFRDLIYANVRATMLGILLVCLALVVAAGLIVTRSVTRPLGGEPLTAAPSMVAAQQLWLPPPAAATAPKPAASSPSPPMRRKTAMPTCRRQPPSRSAARPGAGAINFGRRRRPRAARRG